MASKKVPIRPERTFLNGISGEIDRAVENEKFTDWVFIGVSPSPDNPFESVYKIESSNFPACWRFLIESADLIELTLEKSLPEEQEEEDPGEEE
jgi:hypothetical protein